MNDPLHLSTSQVALESAHAASASPKAPAALSPQDEPLIATVSLHFATQGAAVLLVSIENATDVEMAVVSSLEVQDGMSEPVLPAVVDESAWDLPEQESQAAEVEVQDLPDGAYKIEALVSSIDANGEHGSTLGEMYLLIDDGNAEEISFEEWLPLVNVSEASVDPQDPDPELTGGAQ